MIFKKNLRHSYKSFNKNLLDQHDIKVTLHKYVLKNEQFFDYPIWFWCSAKLGRHTMELHCF